LGRRYVPGHRDERHAECRHDDNCEQQTGHHVPPQMAARPKSYIRKQASAKFKRRAGNGRSFGCGPRWARARFWFDDARIRFRQKCHTESASDSRLLREARMLHYGTTSRSARIVVKLLHESPGPTTAGASLCLDARFSPGPSRSFSCMPPGADLAKQA
jgi:hypothetical protein